MAFKVDVDYGQAVGVKLNKPDTGKESKIDRFRAEECGSDCQNIGEAGQKFYKMSGSGNDFVFFDSRYSDSSLTWENEKSIEEICARGTGIGADGVVWLYGSEQGIFGIRYYNSDGSTASLCGNATLCTVGLLHNLGAFSPDEGVVVETEAGIIKGRIVDNRPEFDLPLVVDIERDSRQIEAQPGEDRIGFTMASIPHVVILVNDIESIDVHNRGRQVRFHPSLSEGANVNFVSRDQTGVWKVRTYERGVEGETLACGTGNVATAILLKEWGLVNDDYVDLMTRSGKFLRVSLCRDGAAWMPSLQGEGRLVFKGELGAS